ncbi:SET domain-containing protein 3 [Batrachochytrium dendrobatidis]|nr:SET domain-containing protein 3 [Batrachochytrium dendrobatidis]
MASLVPVDIEKDGAAEDEGEIRCICGFPDDDGFTIQCDRCFVWQHAICVNITANTVPEQYLCEDCDPRWLDVENAIALQARRLKEAREGKKLQPKKLPGLERHLDKNSPRKKKDNTDGRPLDSKKSKVKARVRDAAGGNPISGLATGSHYSTFSAVLSDSHGDINVHGNMGGLPQVSVQSNSSKHVVTPPRKKHKERENDKSAGTGGSHKHTGPPNESSLGSSSQSLFDSSYTVNSSSRPAGLLHHLTNNTSRHQKDHTTDLNGSISHMNEHTISHNGDSLKQRDASARNLLLNNSRGTTPEPFIRRRRNIVDESRLQFSSIYEAEYAAFIDDFAETSTVQFASLAIERHVTSILPQLFSAALLYLNPPLDKNCMGVHSCNVFVDGSRQTAQCKPIAKHSKAVLDESTLSSTAPDQTMIVEDDTHYLDQVSSPKKLLVVDDDTETTSTTNDMTDSGSSAKSTSVLGAASTTDKDAFAADTDFSPLPSLLAMKASDLSSTYPNAVYSIVDETFPSGARQRGLFTTHSIAANQFISEISGVLSCDQQLDAKERFISTFPMPPPLNTTLLPPYTFYHPCDALKMNDETSGLKLPIALDAREASTGSGRYVRFSCGCKNSPVANAQVHTVVCVTGQEFRELQSKQNKKSVASLSSDASTADTLGPLSKGQVILDDEMEHPVLLNDRVRLCIFSTAPINMNEEVVLHMDSTRSISFPCACLKSSTKCTVMDTVNRIDMFQEHQDDWTSDTTNAEYSAILNARDQLRKLRIDCEQLQQKRWLKGDDLMPSLLSYDHKASPTEAHHNRKHDIDATDDDPNTKRIKLDPDVAVPSVLTSNQLMIKPVGCKKAWMKTYTENIEKPIMLRESSFEDTSRSNLPCDDTGLPFVANNDLTSDGGEQDGLFSSNNTTSAVGDDFLVDSYPAAAENTATSENDIEEPAPVRRVSFRDFMLKRGQAHSTNLNPPIAEEGMADISMNEQSFVAANDSIEENALESPTGLNSKPASSAAILADNLMEIDSKIEADTNTTSSNIVNVHSTLTSESSIVDTIQQAPKLEENHVGFLQKYHTLVSRHKEIHAGADAATLDATPETTTMIDPVSVPSAFKHPATHVDGDQLFPVNLSSSLTTVKSEPVYTVATLHKDFVDTQKKDKTTISDSVVLSPSLHKIPALDITSKSNGDTAAPTVKQELSFESKKSPTLIHTTGTTDTHEDPVTDDRALLYASTYASQSEYKPHLNSSADYDPLLRLDSPSTQLKPDHVTETGFHDSSTSKGSSSIYSGGYRSYTHRPPSPYRDRLASVDRRRFDRSMGGDTAQLGSNGSGLWGDRRNTTSVSLFSRESGEYNAEETGSGISASRNRHAAPYEPRYASSGWGRDFDARGGNSGVMQASLPPPPPPSYLHMTSGDRGRGSTDRGMRLRRDRSRSSSRSKDQNLEHMRDRLRDREREFDTRLEYDREWDSRGMETGGRDRNRDRHRDFGVDREYDRSKVREYPYGNSRYGGGVSTSGGAYGDGDVSPRRLSVSPYVSGNRNGASPIGDRGPVRRPAYGTGFKRSKGKSPSKSPSRSPERSDSRSPPPTSRPPLSEYHEPVRKRKSSLSPSPRSMRVNSHGSSSGSAGVFAPLASGMAAEGTDSNERSKVSSPLAPSIPSAEMPHQSSGGAGQYPTGTTTAGQASAGIAYSRKYGPPPLTGVSPYGRRSRDRYASGSDVPSSNASYRGYDRSNGEESGMRGLHSGVLSNNGGGTGGTSSGYRSGWTTGREGVDRERDLRESLRDHRGRDRDWDRRLD